MTVLMDGDEGARATLVLAHGSGAPMDSPAMNGIAAALAAEGLRVLRFEFAYMAGRRSGGARRPPPKMPILEEEFRAILTELAVEGPLFIGGKSMGGRVATMIADGLPQENFGGVVCFGYPFHPVGKPERLRTGHLEAMSTPVLICQGTRDPFGTSDEVAEYTLSDAVSLHWLEDGDHDLKPRKRLTGLTQGDHFQSAAQAVAAWIDERG